MTTAAQREAQRAFAEQRRRVAAGDRKLHTAPPKSVDAVVGVAGCYRCNAFPVARDDLELTAAPPDEPRYGAVYTHRGGCPTRRLPGGRDRRRRPRRWAA